MKRIAVVGGGYVGLVSAGCLAKLGHDVVCIDIDSSKVELIRSGRLPLEEEGLPELWFTHLGKNLQITSDYGAIRGSELVFLCVGTPRGSDGSADVSQIMAAATRAIESLAPEDRPVFVVKSTVPVGTSERVAELMRRERPWDEGTTVIANPEFLSEGRAVKDFFEPSRVVIGAEEGGERAARVVGELYAPLGAPIAYCDRRTAEMAKYASNAFLATKVSFINEFAELCEACGVDVSRVAQILGMDPDIGPAYLEAGLGWGGSCLPKDLAALREMGLSHGIAMSIVAAVEEVNRRQIALVVGKLGEELGELRGKGVAVLGLTFKPNSDDIRESQSLALVEALAAAGCEVRAYDPVAEAQVRRLYPWLRLASSAYEAAAGAEAVVIGTAWAAFKDMEYGRLREVMRRAVIIDARNCLSQAAVEAAGFRYKGVGRASSLPSSPSRTVVKGNGDLSKQRSDRGASAAAKWGGRE